MMAAILAEPPHSDLEAAERNAEAIRRWYRAIGREVRVEIERVSVPRNTGGIATTYSAVIKTPIGVGGT